MASGGGATERIAKDQAAEEKARQGRITLGKDRIQQTFSKFDEPFFNQVRQASLDLNVPDIGRQYKDARENLAFTLARGGMLNSTLAAGRSANLVEERTRALAQADSLAEGAVRRARSDVEGERSSLVSELLATGDPELAAQSADARARFATSQTPENNIGAWFTNATGGLAAALRPRYDAYGTPTRSGGVQGLRDRSRVIR